MIIRETEVNSILTKSNLPVSDYTVNPYIGCTHACKYCYAEFMKRFTGHTEPWGDFLTVKHWDTIKNPGKYSGKDLFISSVTDPYLPEEAVYRRTRKLLEQLEGSGVRLSIQTKSDLVLRDLDLLLTFPEVRIGFSINTLDEQFRSDMDKAVSIERRLSAMQTLYDAGIPTTCFISPIFPEITDTLEIIERVKNQCSLIWLENLNLRGAYKRVIMEYIAKHYPSLLPLYHDIYQHGDSQYWKELDAEIKQYAKVNGMRYVRNEDWISVEKNEKPVLVNFFYHEQIKKSAQRTRNA